jgi:hypothetical protein
LGCDKYWPYLSFCVCGIARVSSIVILCYIVQDQTGGHSPILVIFYADGEISAGLDHGGLLVVLQAVPGHRRDRDSCNLTCEMGGVAGGIQRWWTGWWRQWGGAPPARRCSLSLSLQIKNTHKHLSQTGQHGSGREPSRTGQQQHLQEDGAHKENFNVISPPNLFQ